MPESRARLFYSPQYKLWQVTKPVLLVCLSSITEVHLKLNILKVMTSFVNIEKK